MVCQAGKGIAFMSERKRHEWYLVGKENYLCRHCGVRAMSSDAVKELDKQRCVWPDPSGYRRGVVFRMINKERDYQDVKWGNNLHTVGEWLLIMQAELDEAKEAWVKNKGDAKALDEMLQVISVGVACMEQHSQES